MTEMRRTSAAVVRATIAVVAAIVIVLGDGSAVGALQSAQLPVPQAQQPAAPAVQRLNLTVGRSMPLNGKKAGTASHFVYGLNGPRIEYELVVSPSTTNLQNRLQALFPGEDITVDVMQGAVILSGRVSSNTIILRVAEITAASSPN